MMAMGYTGERAIPWNKATGPEVMHPHIMRYAWATRFVWGENVHDLGCGAGYGSYILSMVAESVTGYDVDSQTIAWADMHFYAPNLEYAVHNLLDGPPPGVVSQYVAFEVLEHLADPVALLDKLHAPLVWSIPVRVPNRWHKRVYDVQEIIDMMGGSIWYQSKAGDISRPEHAYDEPAYVLGVRP